MSREAPPEQVQIQLESGKVLHYIQKQGDSIQLYSHGAKGTPGYYLSIVIVPRDKGQEAAV